MKKPNPDHSATLSMNTTTTLSLHNHAMFNY